MPLGEGRTNRLPRWSFNALQSERLPLLHKKPARVGVAMTGPASRRDDLQPRPLRPQALNALDGVGCIEVRILDD